MKILFTLLFALAGGLVGAEKKEGTVVFVHGFMRSGGCMWAAKRRFAKQDWKVLNWAYESRKKTIEEHGRDLAVRMRLLRDAAPGKPIHFVTHSMGGLVVQAMLNDPYCPYEAMLGKVVMMAPPNRGSHVARRLCRFAIGRKVFGDQAGRQLMTAGVVGFEEKLGGIPEFIPVLIIAGDAGFNPFLPGKDDGKVACWETRLKRSHQYLRVHAGHSWISWSPKAVIAARKFIEQ